MFQTFFQFYCCGVRNANDWSKIFNEELPISCCPRKFGAFGEFHCNTYSNSTVTEVTTPNTSTTTNDTTDATTPTTKSSEPTAVTGNLHLFNNFLCILLLFYIFLINKYQ